MTFSSTMEVFQVGDIFLFFSEINLDICFQNVIAATLFLSPTAPKISLMVRVFFARLVLISGRLLELLSIRHINKKNISKLIFLGVFNRPSL